MKRHEIDILSLGTGLCFLALAVAYGTGGLGGAAPDARIVWPVVLVVLGITGLASAVVAQLRSDAAHRDDPELEEPAGA
jgi:hypothetical protein